MRDVFVVGVGMTRFGKHMDRSYKSLVGEALEATFKDCGVKKDQIGSAFFSNTGWEQGSIKGQVALRPHGIEKIPITNVENACASGSTAFHHAWLSIASGMVDCSLAVGVEKLYMEDKAKALESFIKGVDVEEASLQFALWTEIVAAAGIKVPEDFKESPRTPFMDMYASHCQRHMSMYGTTQRQLAIITAKNHNFGALNPLAQYQINMTPEDVLADKSIVYPLTRSMCAPLGDGSAAVILCSKEFLKKVKNPKQIKVLATVIVSGRNRGIDEQDISERASSKAYKMAGIGPDDIDVAELHDATAYGELHISETMGFCEIGEGGPFAESGASSMGGKVVINPSGGLISRGHPIGASGLAQIHELVLQLRGEAGKRQVEGARIALNENGGGTIGYEEAALAINILEKAF